MQFFSTKMHIFAYITLTFLEQLSRAVYLKPFSQDSYLIYVNMWANVDGKNFGEKNVKNVTFPVLSILL
jgi:hypothetical protein